MLTRSSRLPQALLAILIAMAMAVPIASAQVLPPLPPLPEEVQVEAPWAAVQAAYQEDFNVDDGGWDNVTAVPPRSSWAWGEPASGPGAAASGSKVWGTDLAGAYMNYECSALVSPPFTIPAGASASVSFKEWRHMETATTIAWDAGLLFVTGDDGATYDKVTPDIGYTSPGISTSVRACLLDQPSGTSGLTGPAGSTPPPPGYSDINVDLDAYAGQTVRFVIAFGSDAFVTRDGWYIDDFTFEATGVPSQVFDFESDDGGFAVVEWDPAGAVPKGWSWGVPSSGPDGGPGTFAMWATGPDGDHGNNECSFIESAPIDLSLVAGTNAFLEWRQWYRGAFGAGGVVQVGDGNGYTNLVPTRGYGSSNPSSALDGCLEHNTQASGGFTGLMDTVGSGLRDYRADLSAWIGQTVTIRYLFAATPTVTTHPGWYVDDVRVVTGVGGQRHTVELVQAPALDDPGLFTPLMNAYQEDFNFDTGGWAESGTGAWQWGDAQSPPEHMPGSISMWGTRLHADYDAEECSALTSVPIALPGADAELGLDTARLSFNMWRNIYNRYDGAHLVASTDGENWTRLTPNGGYDGPLSSFSSAASTRDCLGVTPADPVWTGPSTAPAADEWENVTVDLTAFMGKDVQLRFVFASNPTTHRRGMYIDNVVVQVGAGPSADVVSQCEVLPGWQVTGVAPSWCWGPPTTGTSSARLSWATNLHGAYNRGECSAIEYGPVDTSLIPGLGTLALEFTHSFRGQSSSTAGGLVQVSRDDGATWKTVNPVGGYPANLGSTVRGCLAPEESSQAGFRGTISEERREVRLPGYQGETIMFRFAFGSTTGTPNAGWYLHNVGLTRGAGNVPTTPLSGPVDPLPPVGPLMEKADDALLSSIREDPTDLYEVMVTGRPHEGVSGTDFSTRGAAMTELDAMAAPFFDRVKDIAAGAGGEVVGAWSAGPVVKVRGDLETMLALAEEEQVRDMAEDGEDKVFLVEPIEDDSMRVANSEGRKQLEAEDIWAAGFRGEGINIAVIDTGVDERHEAFKYANGTTRIAKWANCITSTSTCDETRPAIDDHGHGTHVSGTALGSALYNDTDVAPFEEVGVAPAANLFGVKFLSGSGGGSFADAIKSLQWSFDNGADITSNSWGSSCSAGSSVIQVVNQLTALGMLSVFAAGNSGPSSGTIGGPACADTALSVGAIDVNKNIASFSSRGPCSDPTTGTGSRICPDVVAKGVAVRSAIPRDGASQSDPSGYKTWQGTSMATPHIAGAVALIEQMKRHFTDAGWDTANEAEKEVLKMTALDLGDAGPDNVYGWGLPQLLSVYALLNSQDEANIISTFGISSPVVRLGDTTMLSFAVRNLGGAAATGDFVATLEHPDGTVETLADTTPTLALLDGESMQHTVTVSGNVAPGTYTFSGSFHYSWVNTTTNETVFDSLSHVGTFDVKRVFLDFTVDGLDATAGILETQTVTVTAKNTGNEDARAVRVEFTVPDAYWFVPGSGYDPTVPLSRYSDPAPDKVHEDENFGRITLIYEVGDVAVDEAFSFTARLLPTEPGAHNFIGAAKFQDGAGNAFTQGEVIRQTVGLPGL